MNKFFKLKKFSILYLILTFMINNTSYAKNIPSPQTSDYLFIFFDAGETLSLIPVIKKFKENLYSYKIYALGEGAKNILSRENILENVVNIKETCSTNFEIGSSLHREKNMDKEQLKEIVNCIHPKIVITGMVSTYQSQISKGLKKENKSKIIGYYDGFSNPDKKVIEKFPNILNKIYVPSENISTFMINEKFLKKDIFVVGQPALDKFVEDANKINTDSVKKQLKVSPTSKIVSFIGGYGKEYESVFPYFVETCKTMQDDITCLVSIHPAANGAFEKKLVDESKSKNILVMEKDFSTVSLVKASNVVVSQRSTVGIQSLFIGVPSIYLDIPKTNYTNIAIQHNWSKQIKKQIDLKNSLEQILDQRKIYEFPKDINNFIPLNASQTIFNLITKEKENNKK